MREKRTRSSYDPPCMRGWRSARSKARASDATRAGAAPAAATPEVTAAWPPAEAAVTEPEPAPAPPDRAPAAAPQLDPQVEFLRLLEVVTSMCDHVIEYVEADRAERRSMVETLDRLGRVITDGAAAVAAASAAARTGAPPVEPPAAHERVIGGSMDAGPEPVIDLREPAPELRPESATRTTLADATSTEIAVEVRGRFGDRWVDGFEICEVMTTPDGPRYRLRRHRDGVVLPELFDAASIRHIETFDQLAGDSIDGNATGGNARNGHSLDGDRLNGSAGYWSRS